MSSSPVSGSALALGSRFRRCLLIRKLKDAAFAGTARDEFHIQAEFRSTASGRQSRDDKRNRSVRGRREAVAFML